MSQYVSGLKKYKRILDLPDAYSLYWERRAASKSNFFKNLFHKIEYKKVLKYEEVIKEFDLNLVCSNEDREFLMKKHNVNNIALLPNGVDLEYFKAIEHNYEILNRIIFTGNMDYFPNIDAVEYFVNQIFPEILKKIPDAILLIAGQKPVKKVLELQSKKVIVTGFVKDLNMEYSKSTVAISPIRYGAGTLNKVLEPMAMGMPVVSTEIGFKGLGVESGEGVLLAIDTKDFSDKVIKLLTDINYRKQVGERGKKVIYKKFDWDKISLMLDSYFKNLIEQND
jgi:glycosyltransferase involved in cell wall biosynthesis